jgi:hypothetical protein
LSRLRKGEFPAHRNPQEGHEETARQTGSAEHGGDRQGHPASHQAALLSRGEDPHRPHCRPPTLPWIVPPFAFRHLSVAARPIGWMRAITQDRWRQTPRALRTLPGTKQAMRSQIFPPPVVQVISCPQHIGDFTLPWPSGHCATWTLDPSGREIVACSSSLPHLPHVIVPMLMPHFSHTYPAIVGSSIAVFGATRVASCSRSLSRRARWPQSPRS